jgi:hypothetical protein
MQELFQSGVIEALGLTLLREDRGLTMSLQSGQFDRKFIQMAEELAAQSQMIVEVSEDRSRIRVLWRRLH